MALYGGKLTADELKRFKGVKDDVTEWAREHAQNDYHYGSPQSWWASALSQGACSDAEYELARRYYDTMWNYRGD